MFNYCGHGFTIVGFVGIISNFINMKSWEKKLLKAAVKILTVKLNNTIEQAADRIVTGQTKKTTTIDLKETDFKIIK